MNITPIYTHTPPLSQPLSSGKATEVVLIDTLIDQFEKHLIELASQPGKDPKVIELEIYEAISKWLTYHTVNPEKTFCIPFFFGAGVELIEFRPILLSLAGGTYAYLLKPTERHEISPIFSFRGTTPKTASGTLVADMGLRAWAEALFSFELTPALRAGASVIANNYERLSRMVAELRSNPLFIGHSLGGTVSFEFATLFGNHTKGAYSFNSPGISRRAKRVYKKLKEPFEAIAFSTVGDPIKIFSQGRTLGSRVVVSPRNPNLSKAQRHGTCVLPTAREVTEVKEKSTAKKVAIFCAKLLLAIPYRAALLLFGLVSLTVEIYHLTGRGDSLRVLERASNEVHSAALEQKMGEIDSSICAASVFTSHLRTQST